jgi:uncharacterized membrane protein YeaQ/YmgE (transglycosylase-associated protein family)
MSERATAGYCGTVLLIALLVIVLLLIIGVAVIGLVLKLLWLALVGLVIGALARLVLPGQRRLGVLETALYGIGGSLIGGIVADALDLGAILSFVTAVAVAAVLIALVGGSQRREWA